MKGRLAKAATAIFALVFLISACFPASALALSEARRTELKTVRVAYFTDNGFCRVDENGVRSGYGYEYLQYMLPYVNWKYEYVGAGKSWSELVQMFENGEIDILAPTTLTQDRQQKYEFSSRPIMYTYNVLAVSDGDPVPFVSGEYATYNGMRVGVLKDSRRIDDFKEFAANKGFTYELVEFETVQARADALSEGGIIDAYLDSTVNDHSNVRILDKFTSQPDYLAVLKGNTELIDEANYALEQINVYYPELADDLTAKYFSDSDSGRPHFNNAELEYIAQCNEVGEVFYASVHPDNAPYSYFENGEAKGIIADIAKEISQRSGLNIQIVKVGEPKTYYTDSFSDEISIRFDTNDNAALAEARGCILTQPYFSAEICRLTRKSLRQPVKRVAVVNNPGARSELLNSISFDVETVEYYSVGDCVEAVRSGACDATYVLSGAASKAIYENFDGSLVSVAMPGYSAKFCVGVKAEENRLLASILNKAALSLSEDDVHRIVDSNTQQELRGADLFTYLYTNPLMLACFVIIIVALAFLAVLFRLSQKRRKLERQRAYEFERFIGYICAANDEVCEIDLQNMVRTDYNFEDGVVVKHSAPLESVTDFSPVVHPDDAERASGCWSTAAITKLIENHSNNYCECRVADDNGGYRWKAYTVMGIGSDREHPRNVMLFMRDIDDTKRVEEEHRVMLSDALEAAKQASVAKGAFMSRMSHEIRTPLNAIIGFNTLSQNVISKAASTDDYRVAMDKVGEYLGKNVAASRHLLAIVNDVLDIASIESGRMRLAHLRFDVNLTLQNLTNMFKEQCFEKGVHFVTQFGQMETRLLLGDQLRLNQILLNLLSNAVKFTRRGGDVTFCARQRTIREDGVIMTFEIKDTGVGIAPEFMDHIFEPFEQQDAETASEFGGTGLGLPITKNLVEMMQGKIRVESSAGIGSVFTVTLPFELDTEETLYDGGPRDLSHIRALVVDDNKGSAEYMQLVLKRCGVAAEMAYSGRQAVERLLRAKESGDKFDFCLIDWQMPGMNGAETAQRIRAEVGGDVDIVIISAYDNVEDEEDARAAGVKQFMTKPLFQSTVMDYLARNRDFRNTAGDKQDIKQKLGKANILLVEDNLMSKEVATELLKYVGLTVDCASDGVEAVEKFCASAEEEYDLILMDVQMPRMNGYEATKHIRASEHPRAKAVPIVAMTANAFAEDVAASLAAGMDDHLSKPIEQELLFEMLAKYLSKNKDNN